MVGEEDAEVGDVEGFSEPLSAYQDQYLALQDGLEFLYENSQHVFDGFVEVRVEDALQEDWVDIESCLLLLEGALLDEVAADNHDGLIDLLGLSGCGEFPEEAVDVLIDRLERGGLLLAEVVLSHGYLGFKILNRWRVMGLLRGRRVEQRTIVT